MKGFLYGAFCMALFSEVHAQQTVGLIMSSPDAAPGYTFFAPYFSKNSYLINNCGELVHSWASDYLPGVSAYLLEDGTLLRAEYVGESPVGGGGVGGQISQYSWDGDVIWSYPLSNDIPHHDIRSLPNGNILVIVWDKHSSADALSFGRSEVGEFLWSESIIELAPDIEKGGAKMVWRWNLWDHLIQEVDANKLNFGVVSSAPQLLDINFAPRGLTTEDWIHMNAIDYNAELDQIMLSALGFNELWVIDHSTTTLEAASHSGGKGGKGGDLLYRWGNPAAYQQGDFTDQKLFEQHNPHWILDGLPNEHGIMVFNNNVAYANHSAIEIINPPIDYVSGEYGLNDSVFGPSDFSWHYDRAAEGDFFSAIMSSAQQLPNGDVLVCEGTTGRFFEINEDKEILWEYINPVTLSGIVHQYEVPLNGYVFRCHRYDADYAAFEGRDMEGKGYIEEGSEYTCGLITGIEGQEKTDDILLYPSPVSNVLYIEFSTTIEALEVVSINGSVVSTCKNVPTKFQLDVSDLAPGIYIIRFESQQITGFKRFIVQ